MTATNHALTGALIGLTVHNPWIALPAALMSHFVLDVIPHMSTHTILGGIAARKFRVYLVFELAFCIALVALLFSVQPLGWLLASICAFVAASTDLFSIRELKAALAGKLFHPNKVEYLVRRIQWFERPIGGFVEAAWFAGAVVLLWQFL